MLVFLAVFIMLYGGMHTYALSKVWRAFPHSALLAIVLLLWAIVMIAAPFLVWALTRHAWHATATAVSWVAYLWMGFLFLFCIVALALDIGRLLAQLAGHPWHAGGQFLLLASLVPALVLSAYSVVEARQLRIQALNITSPKLGDGQVRIAQISDLHLGMMLGEAFLDEVIARLQAARPDIIVVTGDVLDGSGDDVERLAARFRTLAPPQGVYAVLGNHEFYAGVDKSLGFFRDAGFTVLRGEAQERGGVVLAGEDDRSLGTEARRLPAAVRQQLEASRQNKFVILLKHQPVVSAGEPFDLQLSGHAHGGQIFPFGLFTWLAYGARAGLYRYDDGRMMYINRGTGTWGPPMRLFTPPEITLITLRGSKGGAR